MHVHVKELCTVAIKSRKLLQSATIQRELLMFYVFPFIFILSVYILYI